MVIKIGKRYGEIMFMNEKMVDLFLSLPKGSLLEISKNLDMNYSYSLRVLKIWTSMGLLNDNKSGMRYNIYYTQKGAKLAYDFARMRKILKANGIQWVDKNELPLV